MIRPPLKLRQKLLILLMSVGFVGMAAFVLVIAVADHQLFGRFVPENSMLRDVQSRSALLIQDYYRFMLTPEIISIDQLDNDMALIRQSLDRYRGLVVGQAMKQQLAADIGSAIEALERSGREMISARRRVGRSFIGEHALVDEVELTFRQFQDTVSADVGRAIENNDWEGLTRRYLPELQMVRSLNQQYLLLFLEIRDFHIDTEHGGAERIELLMRQIGNSNTLLERYLQNSDERSRLSADLLRIYQGLLGLVDAFIDSRKQAEFAVSKAEQAGIDLNQAIGNAILATESEGWRDLRESLYLSGVVLILTLTVSYLLIYIGLDRVVRPLEKLQAVIGRLGRGDFRQRYRDVDRGDEIGQLADAFNRMADQLEESVDRQHRFIEQLEQKNMELERFTYTVSHELKAPLVTVNGFVGLLQKDLAADDRDNIDRDMQKISQAIDTMSRQLQDLLELSRVGRAVNPPGRFSITELCREVVQMMQGLIDERDAEIHIREDMPQVCADRARIREVFKNLIENGIKFTSAGQRPRIEIDAEAGPGSVLCRVLDNGPGIEPRYHDKVFGLFDRLDNAVPGTGVGLALVKRIVEIHNGDLWIESQGNGQGSCFCFTLPVPGGN